MTTGMTTDVAHLATRIRDSLGPDSTNMPPWLWRPLLHLLASGEPVTTEDLAQATGRTADEVRHALARLPDTEYDEHGRIIGHGITLRSTPHHFTVDGRQLYTWCALDTLIFPAVLGHPAQVQSPCHGTGVPVHLTVEPDKVTTVQPATAVVSIVTPGSCSSIRTAFCNQVHYFASPAAAQSWLHLSPGSHRPARW
jgi:alkylmercury lyase